jgi:hypothetical protein
VLILVRNGLLLRETAFCNPMCLSILTVP